MDDNEMFEDCLEEQSTTDTVSPLDKLKEWIENHGKFPKNIPEILLKRFLKVCDDDLKQTTDLLLLNYKLRTSAPNLFTNRDIMAKEMQQACQVMQFCPMPKLTKDGMLVTVGGLKDPDPSKFIYLDCIKMALMVFDMRFCSYDDVENNEIANGDIVVMDMKGMSFWHFLKVVKNFTTAKFYTHYTQEAVPIKICQTNVVNPSPAMDRVFNLFKPFMKQEVLDTLIFHSNGYESLQKTVGKEYLPPKYGGTCEIDIDEIHKYQLSMIEKYRDFLLDDDNWRFSK
ncbi:hypothetical protein ACKWTF_008911 [Chironomus riparius]